MTKSNGSSSLDRVPFAILLVIIMSLGLALVLALNTKIQEQQAQLETLQTQAQNLEYREAALQGEVDQLSTTNVLAALAANLGMIPNPYPVVIQMPEGSVYGTPQAAAGSEFTSVAVPSEVNTNPGASGTLNISVTPSPTPTPSDQASPSSSDQESASGEESSAEQAEESAEASSAPQDDQDTEASAVPTAAPTSSAGVR